MVARSDPGDAAHVAQVDPLAIFAFQVDALAEEHVGGVEVQRLGLAAEIDDLVGQLLVHFAGQHVLDDLQRGVVGIAASLDEVRLEAGRGHGPADGGPAPVDDHGLHADRLHEDDVQQEVPEVSLVFHDAAAQLDHRHLAAELADPGERLDEHVGLLFGEFHGGVLPVRRPGGDCPDFRGLVTTRSVVATKMGLSPFGVPCH